MDISKADLIAQYHRLPAQWRADAAKAEEREHLAHLLILAIASRETNMTDEIGDGGHGRGIMQIDDRFHQDFLREYGALEKGKMPPVRAAMFEAAKMLRSAMNEARRDGVGQAGMRLLVAASAYNAGFGGAMRGLANHGDPDYYTTGRDYGRDVLARRQVLAKL